MNSEFKKKGDKKYTKGVDQYRRIYSVASRRGCSTGAKTTCQRLLNSRKHVSHRHKAVDNYKKANAYPECLKTLNQLLKCNQKNREYDVAQRSAWATARNQQAIMELYCEKKLNISDEQFIQAAHNTFIAFRLANSTDKGLKVMKNCAKYLVGLGRYLNSKKLNNEAVKLLRFCYDESQADQKCYSQGQILTMIVESLVEVVAYEEVSTLYLSKVKSDQSSGKSHLEQDCFIAVVMLILQRDVKRAEEVNYDLMGLVPTYASSSQCESAFNLIQFLKQSDSQKFKKETTRPAITCLFPVIIIRKLRQMMIVAPAKKQGEEASEKEKELLKERFY